MAQPVQAKANVVIESGDIHPPLMPGSGSWYRIKKSSPGFLISLFSFVSQSWELALSNSLIYSEAIQRRRFVLRAECIDLMQRILATCYAAVDDPTVSIPLPRLLEVRCWSSLQGTAFIRGEKDILFHDATAVQMAVMEELPETIPVNQLSCKLATINARFRAEWDLLLRDYNYRLVTKEVHLTEEDRTFLELAPHEPDLDVRHMDCARYALFRTREKMALKWIKGSEQHASRCFRNALSLLQQWGYKTIEKAVPGCLVLYFSDALQPNRRELMHIGIFLRDEIVLSKLGLDNPVYEHPLTDVPALYGKYILFVIGAGIGAGAAMCDS